MLKIEVDNPNKAKVNKNFCFDILLLTYPTKHAKKSQHLVDTNPTHSTSAAIKWVLKHIL